MTLPQQGAPGANRGPKKSALDDEHSQRTDVRPADQWPGAGTDSLPAAPVSPLKAPWREWTGQEPPSSVLDHAVLYANYGGFSLLPVSRVGKEPETSWGQFQAQRPTDDQIQRWFNRLDPPNMGIVCGEISLVVVIDVDGPSGEAAVRDRGLPTTATVKTPRGHHYYFQHPGGRLPSRIAILPQVDLRAEGSYVVAPPSTLPTGTYQWLADRSPFDLPPLPHWVVDLAHTPGHGPTGLRPVDFGRVAEGTRDDTCARLAGHLLRAGASPDDVMAIMQAWATNCTPPFPPPATGGSGSALDRGGVLNPRKRQGRCAMNHPRLAASGGPRRDAANSTERRATSARARRHPRTKTFIGGSAQPRTLGLVVAGLVGRA